MQSRDGIQLLGLNFTAGTGLISGRKAFQRPMKKGIELLNAIQNVYLAPAVAAA